MIAAGIVSEGESKPLSQPGQLAWLIIHLYQSFAKARFDEERFHAVFLDADGVYLEDRLIGRGQSSHLAIRLRELFARALAIGARSLIVAHNHPSGDCRPSRSDIAATRRLIDVGRALDIELLDHLIVTREKVYSMRAGGKL